MIEVTYNNNTYQVNPEASMNDLLKRGDLLDLPLSSWKELFLKKDRACSFTCMLKVLLKKIDLYDESSNVNGFYFKDNLIWLDKDTRIGLMNLANCSTEPIGLVLGNEVVTLPVETVKEYLRNLEVYAGKCYLTTATHKLNALKLASVDEIVNYDYTADYPEKLTIQ